MAVQKWVLHMVVVMKIEGLQLWFLVQDKNSHCGMCICLFADFATFRGKSMVDVTRRRECGCNVMMMILRVRRFLFHLIKRRGIDGCF